ncbi:hypothetical protein B0H14DRAFT_2604030 [Mycena olivaceomarginata]|nr:hypothetical protein B0H14DRAFT_2604030 [Mycena olivaceomarginata]
MSIDTLKWIYLPSLHLPEVAINWVTCVDAWVAEWELAGSCRSLAMCGSRLSRSPFSVYKGIFLSQICTGDLSCWETGKAAAATNLSGSTVSVIHSQESDSVFGDPIRSLVTLEARRTELCQVCQQVEGANNNESGFRALPAEFVGLPIGAEPQTSTQL